MSKATAVQHGDFGRAGLYHLDKSIVTHAHREGHLIFYLSGSKCHIQTESGRIELSGDNFAAINPWEPHNFEIEDESDPVVCLVIYIKPIWFLETSSNGEFSLSFGDCNVKKHAQIRDWVTRFVRLLLSNESSDVFDSYLYGLTNECYNQSWSERIHERPSKVVPEKFTDFRVRRSIKLIEENYRDDIGINELARESGISRPHLFKLFKKQVGVTPNVYLATLRAEKAIDELINTDKSVTDISYDLGFSSQASFTRFFASNVGIPPSEYRRVANVG